MPSGNHPLDKLERFVLDNYDCSKRWKDGTLKDWLLWAFEHGYLFLAINQNQDPVGMVIARPLDPKDAVPGSFIEHTPDSGNIYIDLTIGKSAMKPLMAQIVNRFGVRNTISFHRYGGSKEPKFYDFRKFSLKILTSY